MPHGSVGIAAEKFAQIITSLLEVSLSDIRSLARVEPSVYGLRLPTCSTTRPICSA